MSWLSYKEMAKKLDVSQRTIKRWAKDPEKHGLIKREKGFHESGRNRIQLAKKTDQPVDVTKQMNIKPEDIHLAPNEYQFDHFLYKKLLGKTGDNLRQARRYYTRKFRETGEVPESLKVVDGRSVNGGNGRGSAITPEIEQRFCEMVRASAMADPSDPNFMTQRLRKIVNYRRRLLGEFPGVEISKHGLGNLVKKHRLRGFMNRADYDEENISKKVTYFNPEPVLGLIQMDGSTLKWLEMRDDKGVFRQPIVIEFFDTGSRNLLAMDLYSSESSANSVDIFSKFLKATPFPLQKVKIRPDNAPGFLNLKRPIHHLNRKYSMPDRFYMDPDFARVRAPKHKVHLESSHRALHNFEDHIIHTLSDKILERRQGVKFVNNKRITGTITRLDMTISDLAATGLIEKYRVEHNEKMHNFTEGGRTGCKWRPAEKLADFLKGRECIQFTDEDIKEFKLYGYPKSNVRTIQNDGTFQYNSRRWQVVSAEADNFKGVKTKVKLSEVDGEVYLFGPSSDGIMLGKAAAVGESVAPRKITINAEKRLKANEFEMICKYLQECEMRINADRVLGMYNQGLTLKTAVEIYAANKERYESKQNPMIVFNLFISDWGREMEKGHKVLPYANLGN